MKRRIIVDYGERRKLAKIFKCSEQFVGQALLFKTSCLTALKIRRAALNSGGVDTGELLNYKSS